MAKEALKKLDAEAAEKMPAMLKPFMICNGGSAVKTMNCMSCALPATMTETAAATFENYESIEKTINE